MKEHRWYGSYVPQVSRIIDIEKITMPEVLARTARKFPNRVALIFLGRKITYQDLESLAGRFATALTQLGIKRGDRVGLLLPNIPQIVIAYYGLWKMGAVPVPNNPLYTDRELEHQLNDAGASALITLDLLTSRMLALRGRTGVKTLITCHINDYLPFPKKQLFPLLKKAMYRPFEPAPDHYEFLRLMSDAVSEFQGPPPALDDLAFIPYTGGTTGLSKGVVLTHYNVTAITQQMSAWFFDCRDQPERELAIFPFFHLAGFTAVMNLSIMNGWTDILVPRPEPKTVYEMMLQYRPTLIPAVPTIYVGLLGLPDFGKKDLSFVKGFFSGAAPLPMDTITALKAATGADIVEGFGMTESTALVTVTPWRGQLKPGSVGVPLPNTEVRVVDVETGLREMPVGEDGEIVFRGPQMCGGYYNMPEETAVALREGWFHTGDIGRMDEDGYFYIVDRKKDMIIAGGYNIYPREIDEVLFEHPKVSEACAVGVPDAYRGETVKAFIVTKPGQALTAEELDDFCRARLAAYKVPKLYEFIDEMPKSAVGKILRRELRHRPVPS